VRLGFSGHPNETAGNFYRDAVHSHEFRYEVFELVGGLVSVK
jgi:hypothetical protein